MTNPNGILGGSYDSLTLDYEASHHALLAEARRLGRVEAFDEISQIKKKAYAEGFEAGREHRKVERHYDELETVTLESLTAQITPEMQREEEALQAKMSAPNDGVFRSTRKDREAAKLRLAKRDQVRRDKIVERAKADFEKLKQFELNGKKYYLHRGWICTAEFKIKKDRRAVSVYLINIATGKCVGGADAVCSKNDCFNIHIGKSIALHRALLEEEPNEYLSTPQPTEVRVGDIVGFPTRKFDGRRFVAYEVNDIYCLYYHEKSQGSPNKAFRLAGRNLADARIIDDSREEV